MDGDGIVATALSAARSPPASKTAFVISSTNSGMPSVRSIMSCLTVANSGLLPVTRSIIAAISRSPSRLRLSARHDTATLFDWLAATLSYQGISDQVAAEYMERHGRAQWADIDAKVAASSTCPKLASYWHFHGCRYDKISRTCSEPDHIDTCPLPSHELRNGRLNQMAYSLFLFIRDIADGDLVGWMDRRFQAANAPAGSHRLARLREAVIGPLREVYGVSDKVLTMTLSCILLAAPKRLHLWHEVGASMIAIDTLVHNFLVRTGILARFEADHSYGAACAAAVVGGLLIAFAAMPKDDRLCDFPIRSSCRVCDDKCLLDKNGRRLHDHDFDDHSLHRDCCAVAGDFRICVGVAATSRQLLYQLEFLYFPVVGLFAERLHSRR